MPVIEDEAREPVPLVLPLDRDTLAWLMEMSGGSDEKAAQIIADTMREISSWIIEYEVALPTQPPSS